jgi:hypothetical protein
LLQVVALVVDLEPIRTQQAVVALVAFDVRLRQQAAVARPKLR